MQTQVVHLTVDDFCGSVTLVLPDQGDGRSQRHRHRRRVRCRTSVRTGPPYGPLHLVVRGRVRFGSITAR